MTEGPGRSNLKGCCHMSETSSVNVSKIRSFADTAQGVCPAAPEGAVLRKVPDLLHSRVF